MISKIKRSKTSPGSKWCPSQNSSCSPKDQTRPTTPPRKNHTTKQPSWAHETPNSQVLRFARGSEKKTWFPLPRVHRPQTQNHCPGQINRPTTQTSRAPRAASTHVPDGVKPTSIVGAISIDGRPPKPTTLVRVVKEFYVEPSTVLWYRSMRRIHPAFPNFTQPFSWWYSWFDPWLIAKFFGSRCSPDALGADNSSW